MSQKEEQALKRAAEEAIKRAVRNRDRRLNLSNRKLTSFPPEIFSLSELRDLDLSNNQLTELPPEIAQLTYLRDLNLANNQFSQLPWPEILQLHDLKRLNLGNNHLAGLPLDLSSKFREFARQLEYLNLEGGNEQLNKNIYQDFLKETNKPYRMLNYYFSYQERDQTRPLNEAKILVVGEAAVGKTSLIKYLLNKEFNETEKTTKGVEIKKWEVEVNAQKIRLNIWDFGGQPIMHTTHQHFFLTQQCLYLLVLKSRLTALQNQVEYWLKLIKTFGEDSPVIVITTHIDEHPFSEGVDETGLREKYKTIHSFVKISSKQRGSNEKAELDKQITDCLPKIGINDEKSQSYFRVKEKLEHMREFQNRNYIVYDDYVELCREEAITDAQEIKEYIKTSKEVGDILQYDLDDPGLANTYIMNPEWLTTAVYSIINSRVLHQEGGLLKIEQLNQILLDGTRYPADKYLFIIAIFRHLELCYDVPGYTNQQVLIPELFPMNEPPLVADRFSAGEVLRFEYHYEVLPANVMSRFIVNIHLHIRKEANSYWRNGVILVQEESTALIKADRTDKKISIQIIGPTPMDRRELLGKVREKFDKIHDSEKELGANGKIPHKGTSISYEHLRNLERMGETIFVPEGLKEKVRVSALLNGYEKKEKESKPGLGNIIVELLLHWTGLNTARRLLKSIVDWIQPKL